MVLNSVFFVHGAKLKQEMYRKIVLNRALKPLKQNLIGFKPYKLQPHLVISHKATARQIFLRATRYRSDFQSRKASIFTKPITRWTSLQNK